MRILHLSTWDIRGGASRAAYRLHKGLQNLGLHSRMLVQRKECDDDSVIGFGTAREKIRGYLRPFVDKLPLRIYTRRHPVPWTVGWLRNEITKRTAHENPDLIHIHWIGEGFVPITALSEFRRPMVWTLHDMWPFTGGCHYASDCLRSQQFCGACPQLSSHRESDLTKWVWKRKKRYWQDIDLKIVTPSQWLAAISLSSSLFAGKSTQVIPNGLDLTVYKPMSRSVARNIINLNPDKKIILMGALTATQDRRKGFSYLMAAIEHLAEAGWNSKAEAVVIGASEPTEPHRMPLKVNFVGTLHDDISLAVYYAAADVFVAPSLEDNLPNTVMEAMACGTPCVAFNIGGMPDMIEHEKNGRLVKPFSVQELARGIEWVLTQEDGGQRLSENSREKVEREFSIEKVTRRYLSLYEEALQI